VEGPAVSLLGFHADSLKPDIVSIWEQAPWPIRVYISIMVTKRQHSTAAERANLASIYKEMQKPRPTTSARGEGRDQAAQRPATDSGKARVPKSERKG
jgi:hypothetical protein